MHWSTWRACVSRPSLLPGHVTTDTVQSRVVSEPLATPIRLSNVKHVPKRGPSLRLIDEPNTPRCVLEFFIVSRAARACMCRGTPGSVSWSKPQPREEEARGRPLPLGQWGPPRAVSCPLALKLQHGASPSWAACHVLCHCREKRTNSTSCVRCCSGVDFDYFFKTLRCFERENFSQLFRH